MVDFNKHLLTNRYKRLPDAEPVANPDWVERIASDLPNPDFDVFNPPTCVHGIAMDETCLQCRPQIFLPSPQQSGIFNWIVNEDGHAIVIAVAGSGKTTTLIEALSRMDGWILLLAYNKKIADEIRKKLADRGLGNRVRVSTFHAHGFGVWMRHAPQCLLEGYEPNQAGYIKINRIFDEVMVDGQTIPFIYKNFVAKAVTFAKQRLFGYEINFNDRAAWLNLVDHFDLDEEIANELAALDSPEQDAISVQDHVQLAIDWTIRCLKYSIQIAREVIDYEDMIYMPLVAKVNVRYKNDWVLVDEAQDTNHARRAYVRLVLKPTGRTIWVGDPRQAIYGFTGADDKSLDSIRQQFGCVDLPLTVSYRCPRAVVQVAQMWVSHIEAHPDAPDGIFRSISKQQFVQMQFQPTDSILCRVNAPLVGLALQFIRRGIPCHVEGRDIGESLIKLIDRFKNVENLDHLTKTLEEFREEQISKNMAKGKEGKAEHIADMVESLLEAIRAMPIGSTIQELRDKIYNMFRDAEHQKKQVLVLSSIHKSKGREWPRVFWYGPDVFQPSKYARQDWQRRQETNLYYVAATRSKSELYRVRAS